MYLLDESIEKSIQQVISVCDGKINMNSYGKVMLFFMATKVKPTIVKI